MEIIYRANDGTEFYDKDDCMEYEERQRLSEMKLTSRFWDRTGHPLLIEDLAGTVEHAYYAELTTDEEADFIDNYAYEKVGCCIFGLIPILLEKWREGFDIVQTLRKSTEGVSIFKKVSSSLYYRLLNVISDIPISAGSSDFRLMSRRAVLAFRKFHEHDKFIRGLVQSMGFNQTTIEFVAPERFAGKSKFTLRKMMRLAVDGILAHSTTPLRMAFYAGLFCGLFSVVLFVHVLYETAVGNVVPGWATLTILISFFGGLQLVFLGIVGEYISRIFREVKNRPLYFTDEERRSLRD